MIEIFLDNNRIYYDGKDIKMTKENPYFTESGSYSLEVSLPLQTAENLMAIGEVRRMDVKKEQKRFNARIINNNKEIFNGKALLVEINPDTAKIQLIGGNSEVANSLSDDNLYIDGLDYSDIDLDALAVENGADLSFRSLTKEVKIARSGGFGLPFYFQYVPFSEANSNTEYNGYKDFDPPGSGNLVDDNGPIAALPNFLFILRLVIKKLGFTVKRCDYDDTPLKYVYIVPQRNSVGAWAFNAAIPHWTVKQYFTEVKNWLNCSIFFDETEKTVSIVSNSFMHNNVTKLEAIDDFKVEFDDDNRGSAISTADIYYANVDSKITEVFEKYEHKSFKTAEELLAYANSLSEYDRQRCVFHLNTLNYFWSKRDNNFIELKNVRYRGNYNKIELKIVPSHYKTEFDWSEPGRDQKYNTLMMYLEIESPEVEENDSTIYDYINENGQKDEYGSEKADRMEVAFVYRPNNTIYGPFPGGTIESLVPGANEYELYPTGIPNQPQANTWSFELGESVRPDNQFKIGDLHKENIKAMDGVINRIQFISTEIPDISNVFQIRNKLYLCKKIEYNIKEDGISPLMTGEFYEIES